MKTPEEYRCPICHLWHEVGTPCPVALDDLRRRVTELEEWRKKMEEEK